MALMVMIVLLGVLGFAFPPFWIAALVLLGVGLWRPALWRKPLKGRPNPDLKGWNERR
ncbi:MAG: hypothetical protein R3310_08735 [Candidatus Competibacteraceae bacterium]|nr:hypothetical protein [Candidatus Competibacteraceae bacterium]